MKLAGIALTPPIAAMSVAIFAALGAWGNPISWVGGHGTSWEEPANWDPVGVPGASDEVTIGKKNAQVTAENGFAVSSLTVSNGVQLTIGNKTSLPEWTVSIAGDLSLDTSAKFYAYAPSLPDLSVFTNRAVATAALFRNAAIVSVGGTFTISGGAAAYPVCDRLSGNPVFFRVKDFNLAADGTIDVKKAGWGVFKTPTEGRPEGALNANLSYSYGFGTGNSYTLGGGYGGFGGGWNASNGNSYGSPYAPFLSGSPSGLNNLNNVNDVTGPGAAVVFASGVATVAGTVNANGTQPECSGCSGGSIWIAAKTLSVSPSATLTATTTKLNSTYKGGGGGRISLAENVTDAEIAALAATTGLPEEFASHPLVECVTDVTGAGVCVSNVLDGTATFVTYCGKGLVLDNFTDTPVVAEGLPFYGVRLIDGADCSITAPEYSGVAEDPEFVRIACAGHVLSNATAEVKASASRTLTFTPNAAEGPYSVTWKWSGREYRVRAHASGGGTVSVPNAWYAAGTEVTLNATPAAGKRFVCWIGDIPGGKSTAAQISFTLEAGCRITAVFANEDGATQAKAWTGGAGTASWDDAGNWSPAGVPTADDAVTIASGTVTAPRGIVAGSLALGSGAALSLASTGSSVTAAPQDESEAAATRFLYVAGNLSNAGQLKLGGIGDVVRRFVFEVGGDVVLSGASKTAVYAARGVGDVATPAQLYAKRTDFKIGGGLILSDTAILYPVCDPLTGTAVFLDAASASVASGASVNANGLGYDWVTCVDGIKDARAKFTLNFSVNGASAKPELRQTFGAGAGNSYYIGAGHGGKSLGANATNGKTYGSQFAPLTGGSPSGQLNDNATAAGGGVVWLRVAGTLSVAGTIAASPSVKVSGGGASGGGIWLMAKDFAFDAGAKVVAHGGECTYGAGAAGGGRVSLASGMTDAALEKIVGLEELDEDYLETEVVECVPDVAGTTVGSSHGYAGTVTRVSYVAGATFLTLETDTAVDAAGLVWTTTPVGDGEAVSVTAPQYGYLSANPEAVRYACAGYELYDAAGLVRAETTRTCAFTAVSSEGPYRLVFKWANPEHRFRADKSSGGASTISANGVVSDSIDLWLAEGTEVTLGAVAADGFDFVGWIGDVPGGRQAAAAVGPFVPAIGAEVTAYFRRADGVLSEKTWTGAAMARWDDAANWSPAGVPTLDDDVTVDGTVFAPRGIVAGALTVGASGKVLLATKDDSTSNAAQDVTDAAPTRFLLVGGDLASAGRMILGSNGDAVARFVYSVGGDLTLSGSSVTAVFPARTTGEVSSNALAAARTDFSVGGKMTLADTAVLYPNCDPLTGTAVRFGVGSLTVGASAKVNATGLGYGWQRCPDGTAETKDPRSLFTTTIVTPETNLPEIYQSFGPGTGYSFEDGAGHGGTGGYWNSSRHSAYGKAYDRFEAPVMPGSPNGVYNRMMSNTGRGGGVIWFAVTGRAEIAGVLEAKGAYADNFGGASGGSIFLTAYEFGWSGAAALSVKGVNTGYNAQGAGGRIALGEGLQESRLSQLEATGVSNLRAKHHIDVTTYTNRVPVSVDISSGGGSRAEAGSFVYLEHPNIGLMLLVR